MATETRVIKLDVDARQAEKATKMLDSHFKRLNNRARTVTESIFRFQMGLQALAHFLAIKEITDLADSYTILSSRLSIVIKNTDQLQRAQKDLNKLANEVFTDVGTVAKAYTDLQLKLKNVKLSHEDTITVVRTMAQSFRVSGSTAKEAASSTLQLMQALSSGRLQGDELKTLRESNILLLNAIEDEYRRINKLQKNATLDIQKLGEEGKMTPVLILNALKNSAPKFEAQAKKLRITFENIFVRARNKLKEFMGDLENRKVFEPLKNSLLKLADSADSAAVAMGTFVAGIISVSVLNGIKNLAKAIRTLNFALAGNPLFVVAGLAGVVAGYLYEISKTTTIVNKKMYNSFELIIEMIKLLFKDLIDWIVKKTYAFEKKFGLWSAFIEGLNEIIKATNTAINGVRVFFEYVITGIGHLTNALNLVVEVIKTVFRLLHAYKKGELSLFTIPKESWNMLEKVATYDQAKEQLTEDLKKNVEKIWKENVLGEVGKEIGDIFDFSNFFNSYIKSFSKRLDELKERAAGNLKEIKQETNKTNDEIVSNIAYKVKKVRDFVKEGLDKYIGDIKDWGKQVSEMATRTMKNFEDAIVKAVTTGKLEFKSLADSILEDLARIMVRQKITLPIAQAFSAYLGEKTTKKPIPTPPTPTTPAPTVSAPVPTISAPTPVISTGATGGFADSSVTPLFSVSAVRGARSATTNVNVQNFTGQQAQVSESTAPDGTKNIRVTIGQIVKDGISSGQYDRVLAGAFNLRRVGTR